MTKKVRKGYPRWMFDINMATNLAALVLTTASTRKKKRIRRIVRVMFNQQQRMFPPPRPLRYRVWYAIRRLARRIKNYPANRRSMAQRKPKVGAA